MECKLFAVAPETNCQGLFNQNAKIPATFGCHRDFILHLIEW